ncbi:MAG: cytochrome c3 family protein [Acidobacteria bacterium]|nr:cytochrome c3 family protein [Acidobacteriota bacterium]
MTVPKGLKILLLGSALVVSLAYFKAPRWDRPAPASSISAPALQAPANGTTSDQPIAFTHKAHIEAEMECLACHEFADKAVQATIPGVESCMTCHSAIKTESPEIIKLAQYAERGEEVPWRRVYKFKADAHVYFTHKRHIKAEVSCTTCHGEMEKAATAQLNVNHSMGWCLDCHRTSETKFKPPSRALDCMTCHN